MKPKHGNFAQQNRYNNWQVHKIWDKIYILKIWHLGCWVIVFTHGVRMGGNGSGGGKKFVRTVSQKP